MLFFFRGDKYHRSWRDWQWATKHAEGHHDWTSIQLNYVFNINYQPVGVGGHFGKRQEMKLEWEQLFPKPGPEFASLAQNISLDAREPPPTGLRGVRELYRKLLDDNLGTRKGAFMKQSAWYDIIKHIDKYDPLWHCRRFEMEQLASFFAGARLPEQSLHKANCQAYPTGHGGGGDGDYQTNVSEPYETPTEGRRQLFTISSQVDEQ